MFEDFEFIFASCGSKFEQMAIDLIEAVSV